MNIALFGYILAWLGVIYAVVSIALVFIALINDFLSFKEDE